MLSRHLLCSLAVLISSGALAAAEPARDRDGDPLPDGAVVRLGDGCLRHESDVGAYDFSPDGKILAAVEAGHFVTSWDPTTGRRLRRVAVNLPHIWGIFFTRDGKSLILAGGGVLCIVDAVTGAQKRRFDLPRENSFFALDVARDGKSVLTILSTGDLIVWNVADGTRRHQLKNRTEARLGNYRVALTPDGKRLVLPHADGSLHLLDVASGKEILAFEMPPPPRPGLGPSDPYQRVLVSPDGRYLVYASPTNSAALCDMKTGKRVRQLEARLVGLSGMDFSPDGRLLAVSGPDGLSVFEVASGKELRTFSKAPEGWPLFAPDSRTLCIADGAGLLLWDVATGRLLRGPDGHRQRVDSLAFFPDGKRLVSCARNREMIVWDIATSRLIAERPSDLARDVFVGRDDSDSVQYHADKSVHRWDPAANRVERQAIFRPPSECQTCVISPDGQRMAALTQGASPKLHLLDHKGTVRTVPVVLRTPEYQQRYGVRPVFSPDGQRLLLGLSDGVLRLLDAATGEAVRDLEPELQRPTLGATFAADGRSIAVFDSDLRIREVATGGDRLRLTLPDRPFNLALSPDGRFLACAPRDNSILILSTTTGCELARWKGQQGPVSSLAFSRDSRLLASGGVNGVTLVWKLPASDGLAAALSAEQADAFWQDLADLDADLAGRAIAALSAAPAQAVPLIKERFRAERKRITNEEIARLIADLDADAFKVREKATRALMEAGADAADALRKALAADPSPEVKRRIKSLLERLNKGDPRQLRAVRAIEVLERIGTPAATDALRDLSRKPLPADLADEVRASLRRMGDRP